MAGRPRQDRTLEGFETHRARFVGMTVDALEHFPDIDEVMTFTVTATCVGRGTDRMRNGELRYTSRMEVRSVEVVEWSEGPATGQTHDPATE